MMKQRLLAMLLAVCMVTSMLPTVAFAQGTEAAPQALTPDNGWRIEEPPLRFAPLIAEPVSEHSLRLFGSTDEVLTLTEPDGTSELKMLMDASNMIRQALLEGKTRINLSLPLTVDALTQFRCIGFYCPYLGPEIECELWTSGDKYSYLLIKNNCTDTVAWVAQVDAALAKLNALVCEGTSLLDMTLIWHDYLCANYQYDYTYEKYYPSEIMLTGTGVCQAYAYLLQYLLNHRGVDCYFASSESMMHGWNIVKLDGNYYHVDATWDDPNFIGLASHKYFLITDDTIKDDTHNHRDWDLTYACTDNAYEQNAYFSKATSPVAFVGTDRYFITYDSSAKKTHLQKYDTETEQTTTCKTLDPWYVYGSQTGFWTDAYSGLSEYNGKLYYNTYDTVYTYDPASGIATSVQKLDTSEGYAYGSLADEGILYWDCRKSPNDGENKKSFPLYYQKHDGIPFDIWSSKIELPTTAGNYVLTEDVTLSEVWEVPVGTTNLCLNGHVIQLVLEEGEGEGGNSSVIQIPENTTLNLYDCNGDGQTHYFTVDEISGLWALADAETAISVTGGVITGGSSIVGGGGVLIAAAGESGKPGVFNMYGGTIAGCTAFDCGGGVLLEEAESPDDKRSVFHMYGGTIAGCTASGNGGGVKNNGTFIMTGGTITGCTAGEGGGGVCNDDSFTLDGGTITGCTATESGGGIYNASVFTMTDGTITGCTAGNGGGVSIFTMTDDTLTDCTAGNDSSVENKGTFIMSGGTITGCTASTNGGGVSIGECSSATMTGGIITNCNAETSGGGIDLSWSGSLTVGGSAKVEGNTCGSAANNVNLRENQEAQEEYSDSLSLSLGTDEAAPRKEMHIGVTGKDGAFTSNGTADDVKYFFPDSKGQYIEFKGNQLCLGSDAAPKFAGAYLTIENDISVNFVVEKSSFAKKDMSVTYTVDGENPITISGDKVQEDATYYIFHLDALNPSQLGTAITATLLWDGKSTAGKTYSIADYCYNKLCDPKQKSNIFKTLLVDLLNYGAEAQKYVAAKEGKTLTEEDLCNAGLTPDQQKTFATQGTPTLTGKKQEVQYPTAKDSKVAWSGQTLALGETVAIRCYVTGLEAGMAGKVLNGTDGTPEGTTLLQEGIYNDGDGKGDYIKCTLPAANMRDCPVFAVYDGADLVSSCLAYSIESYAAEVSNKAPEYPLVIAMMKYGDSANAYWTEKNSPKEAK